MKTQIKDADVNAELKEFFLDQLQGAYWLEEKAVKAKSNLYNSAITGSDQHDAVPVFIGQKAENYETATYNGLINLAKMFGYDNALYVMQQILEEKKKADELLLQAI